MRQRQRRANKQMQLELAALFAGRQTFHDLDRLITRVVGDAEGSHHISIPEVRFSSDLRHCDVFWQPPLLPHPYVLTDKAIHIIACGLIKTKPTLINYFAKRMGSGRAPLITFKPYLD